MKHILENNRICAIMRGVPLGKTLDYADAVYRGGVRMFEVAMNSGDAARQIELMRKHFGDNAYVGAGTVISAKRCEAAREAGAQFSSPHRQPRAPWNSAADTTSLFFPACLPQRMWPCAWSTDIPS